MRTIPPSLLAAAEAANLRLLKSTLFIITGITEGAELDSAWDQIVLPIKMHGMGLRCGSTATAAAHIASEYVCAAEVSAAINAPAEVAAFKEWEAAEAAREASSTAPSSPAPPPPSPLPFVVPPSATASIDAARAALPPASCAYLDENPIDKKESPHNRRLAAVHSSPAPSRSSDPRRTCILRPGRLSGY